MTSALSRAFAVRSKLYLAGAQLGFFPEVKDADFLCKSGTSSIHVSQIPLSKRDEIYRGLKRVIDVCKQLPAGMKSDLTQAALFRIAAFSESSQSLITSKKSIEALESFHSPYIDASKNVLENTLGTERAAIAEAFLSIARSRVTSATGQGEDIIAADSALQSSIQAASNVDDLQYLTTESNYIDDSSRRQLVESLSALLPNALALARAHSLSLLVSKLCGKSADSVTNQKKVHSIIPTSSNGIEAPTQGEINEKEVKPSLQQLHLQVVLNASDVADLVITGTVNGKNTDTFNETVQDTRFVLSRTALIRASARRNYASVLLLEAVEALTGEFILSRPSGLIEKEAETQRDAAKTEFGSQALAMSLTTQAQTQITSALELVDNSLIRLKELNANLKSNDNISISSDTKKHAWTNLVIDLRLMRSELTCAAAELGLITGLFSIWQQPISDSKNVVLFPLADDLADAVGPVVKVVSAAAESSLKQTEEIETLLKSGVTFADHGRFRGVSQPLTTIGLLQFVAGKAVTGEGLFRSAIDHLTEEASRESSSIQNASSSVAAQTRFGIEGDVVLWQSRLSVTQQAQAASTLHVYGALLKQWEKRESEAKLVTTLSESLFISASKPLGINLPKRALFGEKDTRRDFLTSRLFSSALTLIHVGSIGGVFLLDWGRI